MGGGWFLRVGWRLPPWAGWVFPTIGLVSAAAVCLRAGPVRSGLGGEERLVGGRLSGRVGSGMTAWVGGLVGAGLVLVGSGTG